MGNFAKCEFFVIRGSIPVRCACACASARQFIYIIIRGHYKASIKMWLKEKNRSKGCAPLEYLRTMVARERYYCHYFYYIILSSTCVFNMFTVDRAVRKATAEHTAAAATRTLEDRSGPFIRTWPLYVTDTHTLTHSHAHMCFCVY